MRKYIGKPSLCHQRSGSTFLEAIADPVQGFNHVKFAIGRLEPLAQALYVAVDGAVVHVDLIVVATSIRAFRLLTTPGRLTSACKIRNSVTVKMMGSFFQVQL
jgi:hypothetical protein